MEGWILMSNKRLYRASQGAMISGVCQGIADYFKMDATIIRLIWVVVTIWICWCCFIYSLYFYYSRSSDCYSSAKTTTEKFSV